MIPGLILLGLIFGRWWRFVIVAGAAYWTWTIANLGTLPDTRAGTLMSVAFVGAMNTAAGAVLNRCLAALFRKLPGEGRWPGT